MTSMAVLPLARRHPLSSSDYAEVEHDPEVGVPEVLPGRQAGPCFSGGTAVHHHFLSDGSRDLRARETRAGPTRPPVDQVVAREERAHHIDSGRTRIDPSTEVREPRSPLESSADRDDVGHRRRKVFPG